MEPTDQCPCLQVEVPGTLLRKSRWNGSTLPTVVILTIHPYVGPPSEDHTPNYLLAPPSGLLLGGIYTNAGELKFFKVASYMRYCYAISRLQ